MAKKIDFTKSVFELTKEYPELVEIMKGLGFSEISKPAILNSVGRVMTIPKGAKMKQIPIETIVKSLREKGFEIEGSTDADKEPVQLLAKTEKSREEGAEPKERKRKLKDYLKRLGEGEELEQVRAEFADNFRDVEAIEIMEAEQEMIREGTPLTEVQRLCDLHSALFHGATKEEKSERDEASVRTFFHGKRISSENISEEKNSDVVMLSRIPGHPLALFVKENEALAALLDRFFQTKEDEVLPKIRELSIHYAKKGDLLYPHLKVKYGIFGPADVMWTVDDEIRDVLGTLEREKERDECWKERLVSVLERAREMIYKEQNILFPICAENFTEEEWMGIYQDSKDYAACFGIENEIWEKAETREKEGEEPALLLEDGNSEIVLPGGHMTSAQLRALLNTIPMEITFIDDQNINRFFNEGPKAFKRPQMAIDRDVFSCHPPKIEPMVRSIIEDFRNGVKDNFPVWMEKNGRTVLVMYMAVRDHKGEYVGTVELVQDMEFAKAHFEEEIPITSSYERRLRKD